MLQRPKWWNSPMMLVAWIVVAGIILGSTVQTPNTIGGGAGVMVVLITTAVILNAAFQFFMRKRQKRKEEKNPN
jgi:uncharacterized RDD family membrane protein YckC